ncbi:MAG: hypothetical protein EAZ10_14715, partial [Oscillatoriales cyanobacterium]
INSGEERIFDFRFGIDSTDKSRGGYHRSKFACQSTRPRLLQTRPFLLKILDLTAKNLAINPVFSPARVIPGEN